MKFNFGQLSAKYWGWIIRFSLKLVHFQHSSICSQNQWISTLDNSVQSIKAKNRSFSSLLNLKSKQWISTFVNSWQNTKAIPLPLGQNGSLLVLNQAPWHSIAVNSEQRSKPLGLFAIHKWIIFITFQSAVKPNHVQIPTHFKAKYQGYILTYWPKMAHFHHLPICTQTKAPSISVTFIFNTIDS